MLHCVAQAVELRERLRQLEAEAADLQGPSAIEMQQSAVEGMEAAGVPISDDFTAAHGSPARPGAASARAMTGWKVGGLLPLFPSLPPPSNLETHAGLAHPTIRDAAS